jgi:hypothetical protein
MKQARHRALFYPWRQNSGNPCDTRAGVNRGVSFSDSSGSVAQLTRDNLRRGQKIPAAHMLQQQSVLQVPKSQAMKRSIASPLQHDEDSVGKARFLIFSVTAEMYAMRCPAAMRHLTGVRLPAHVHAARAHKFLHVSTKACDWPKNATLYVPRSRRMCAGSTSRSSIKGGRRPRGLPLSRAWPAGDLGEGITLDAVHIGHWKRHQLVYRRYREARPGCGSM